jgi:hypothetical protein
MSATAAPDSPIPKASVSPEFPESAVVADAMEVMPRNPWREEGGSPTNPAG